MAAISELEQVDPWDGSVDALDLFHGPVLIVLTLDRKYRACDSREVLIDIPGPKIRMEPDVVPAPKGRIRVGMIAREFVSQGGGFISSPGHFDTTYRNVF